MENSNDSAQKLPMLTPKNLDGPQRVIKQIMVIDPNKLRVSGLDLKMAEALKKSNKTSASLSKLNISKEHKLALAKSLLNKKIKKAQMTKEVAKRDTLPDHSHARRAECAIEKNSLPPNDTSSLMPPPVSPSAPFPNKSCTLLLNFLKKDQKSGSIEVNVLNPSRGSHKKMQAEEIPKASIKRSTLNKEKVIFPSRVVTPEATFETMKRPEPVAKVLQPIEQDCRKACSSEKSVSDQIREYIEAHRKPYSSKKQKPRVIESKILSPDEKIDLKTLYVKSQVQIIPDVAPVKTAVKPSSNVNETQSNEGLVNISPKVTKQICRENDLYSPKVKQKPTACTAKAEVEESAIDFINNLSHMFGAHPESVSTLIKEEKSAEEDATSFLKAFFQQQQRPALDSTLQTTNIKVEPTYESQDREKIYDSVSEVTTPPQINDFIDSTARKETVQIKSETSFVIIPKSSYENARKATTTTTTETEEVHGRILAEKYSTEDIAKSSKLHQISAVEEHEKELNKLPTSQNVASSGATELNITRSSNVQTLEHDYSRPEKVNHTDSSSLHEQQSSSIVNLFTASGSQTDTLILANETDPVKDSAISKHITNLQPEVSAVKPKDIDSPSNLKGEEASSVPPTGPNPRRKGKKSVPVLIAKLIRNRKPPVATNEGFKSEQISSTNEKQAKHDLGAGAVCRKDSSDIEKSSHDETLHHAKDVLTGQQVGTISQPPVVEECSKFSDNSGKLCASKEIQEIQQIKKKSDDYEKGVAESNDEAIGPSNNRAFAEKSEICGIKSSGLSLEANFSSNLSDKISQKESNTIQMSKAKQDAEIEMQRTPKVLETIEGKTFENSTSPKVNEITKDDGKISKKNNLSQTDTCGLKILGPEVEVGNPLTKVIDPAIPELMTVQVLSKEVNQNPDKFQKLDLNRENIPESSDQTIRGFKIQEDATKVLEHETLDSDAPTTALVTESHEQNIVCCIAKDEIASSPRSATNSDKTNENNQLVHNTNDQTQSPIKERLTNENKLNIKKRLSTEELYTDLEQEHSKANDLLKSCHTINPEETGAQSVQTFPLIKNELSPSSSSSSIEDQTPTEIPVETSADDTLSTKKTRRSLKSKKTNESITMDKNTGECLNRKSLETDTSILETKIVSPSSSSSPIDQKKVISNMSPTDVTPGVSTFDGITPRSRKKTAKFEAYSKSAVKNLKKSCSIKDFESSKSDTSLLSPSTSAESPQTVKVGRKKSKLETISKQPQDIFDTSSTKVLAEKHVEASYQQESPKSLMSTSTSADSPQITKTGRRKTKLEKKCKLPQEGFMESEKSPSTSAESSPKTKVGRKKTKLESKCRRTQDSFGFTETAISPFTSSELPPISKVCGKKTKLQQDSSHVTKTELSIETSADACHQLESSKNDQSLTSTSASAASPQIKKAGRKSAKLGATETDHGSKKPVDVSSQSCDGTQDVTAELKSVEQNDAVAIKETAPNKTPKPTKSSKAEKTPKQRKSKNPFRKVKSCEKYDSKKQEDTDHNSIADGGSNDDVDFLGFNEEEIEEGQQSTSLRLSQSDDICPKQLQSPPITTIGTQKDRRNKKSPLEGKSKKKVDHANLKNTLGASLKSWLVTQAKENTESDSKKMKEKSKILAPPKKRRDSYHNLIQSHATDIGTSSIKTEKSDNIISGPEVKAPSEEKVCTETPRRRGRIKVKNLEQINNSVETPEPINDVQLTIERKNSKRGRKKRKKSDDEDDAEIQEPPAKIPHLSSEVDSGLPRQLKQKPNRIPSLHLGTCKYIPANVSEKKYKNDTEFNPRLLLIRQKGELKTDEPLIDPDMQTVPKTKDDVQCALCMGFAPKKKWLQHLSGHYGVGWIMGFPPPLNVKSRSSVLNCMIDFFKVSKVKGLNCRLCQVQRRSALGLLVHLEQCCLTEEEIKDTRVNCEHCHNNYAKNTLPVHLRSCPALRKPKIPEPVQQLVSDSNTEEVILSNTGRYKRKSVIRAENKFKDMSNLDFIPDELIKYIPKTTKITSDWVSEIQKFGKGFCAQKKCPFTATSVEELVEHCRVGVCRFYCRSGYFCMKCNFYDPNIEPVRSHVRSNHTPMPQNDFEDSGDEACFGSESSSETDFSGDEEETGDGSVANEEENQSRSKIKRRRGEKEIKKNVWVKKHVNNMSAIVRKLFPDRSPFIASIVEKCFGNFVKKNYSSEPLFTFALPSEFHINGMEELKSYFPTSSMSMKFVQNGFEGFVGELGKTQVESDQWQVLERLKGVASSTEHLMYLGGPVNCISWVPLEPHPSSSIQYLAVACRKAIDKYSRFKQPKCSRSLIFIQKYNISNSLEMGGEILYALAIDKGPIHCIEFLPSGGYAPELNRLGLLAVGTINSEINVYSLPIEVEKNNCDIFKIISLEPALVLCLDLAVDSNEYSDVYKSQCTTLVWSQTIGHNYIVGGYLNGFIAIWDISDDEENLNRFLINGSRKFVPVSYFWAMDNKLKIAVHYDMNGLRWLAVCNSSRRLQIYDLREITKPILFFSDTTKNVSNRIHWPVVWENPSYCLGNEMPSYGCCINTMSPMNLGYGNRRLDKFCSGVNDLDFNVWNNIYAAGADNGDVHVFDLKEANLDVSCRGKVDLKVVSTLDIVPLNGAPMNSMTNLSDVRRWNETDYKENYGITFGSVQSLMASNNPSFYDAKRIPSLNLCRLMRINRVQFNPNKNASALLAVGYNNGFLRLINNDWKKTLKEHLK